MAENTFGFKIQPNEIGEKEGFIVFTGFQLRKENNPEYDSDDENEFRTGTQSELIDATFGKEHKLG